MVGVVRGSTVATVCVLSFLLLSLYQGVAELYFYILLLVQTFLFRFKFEDEKLITLGVGLHQNGENRFLNRIVKSELNKKC